MMRYLGVDRNPTETLKGLKNRLGCASILAQMFFSRRGCICLLLVAQILAMTLYCGAATLCVRADGTSAVELDCDLNRCAAPGDVSDRTAISETGCRDFSIPAALHCERAAGARGLSSLSLQLFATQLSLATPCFLIQSPQSTLSPIAASSLLAPAHPALSLLSTVILTV